MSACDLAVRIRPATPEDRAAILEVYRRSEDFLALGPERRATPAMVERDLAEAAAEGGAFRVVEAEGGEVAGVVSFTPRLPADPARAFLFLLMIAAPWRRKGIGAAVVRAVEGEVRLDPRVRSICSAVQVNNPEAIRFWRRLGYSGGGAPEPQPDGTVVYLLAKDLR